MFTKSSAVSDGEWRARIRRAAPPRRSYPKRFDLAMHLVHDGPHHIELDPGLDRMYRRTVRGDT
jgi:hypothetical protein